MATLQYKNFDLYIEKSGDGYRARILDSPAGNAVGIFERPFSDLEMENFYLRVGRPRAGVRRIDSPEMEAARKVGQRLFEAIFTDEIYACYRASLNDSRAEGNGLRIRLRVDAAELNDLPWEFLYNANLNRFLSLSTDTPIIRYIELPQAILPMKVSPPINVLVMISSPNDYPPLDVETEWNKLKEAVADLEERQLITLTRIEKATLTELQRTLRRGTYHAFHFVGHGGFDERAQDGVLVFENDAGSGRPLNGSYLGTILHDHRSLRLAILNACEGARSSRTDPFSGVAQSLVQQGIPAVIAMQFEITDQAAIAMAHEFYAAISDGYPVDAALAESRKAIFAMENDVEWGTPVLYLRSPDGRIFELDRPADIPLASPDTVTQLQTPPSQSDNEEASARSTGQLLRPNAKQTSQSVSAAPDTTAQTSIKPSTDRSLDLQPTVIDNLIIKPVTEPAGPNLPEPKIQHVSEASAQPLTRQAKKLSPVAYMGIGALVIIALASVFFAWVLGGDDGNNNVVQTEPISTTLPAVALASTATPSPSLAATTQALAATAPVATHTQRAAIDATPTIPLPTASPAPTVISLPIVWRDNFGIDMVLVPAGDFVMGGEDRTDAEKPVHTVFLDTFYIDKYEVTNGRYQECVAAGVCQAPHSNRSRTRTNYYNDSAFFHYPVVYVSWQDAQTYCQFRGARLPTEAEWEKAARGTDGRTYPWGENLVCANANYRSCIGDTQPVGAYKDGISPYGAFDMSGNVWEYVADWYDETYYISSPLENPEGPPKGTEVVLRGGGFETSQHGIKTYNRGANFPSSYNENDGFRCAITP